MESFPDAALLCVFPAVTCPTAAADPAVEDLGLAPVVVLLSGAVLPVGDPREPLADEFSLRAAGPLLPFSTGLAADGAFFFAVPPGSWAFSVLLLVPGLVFAGAVCGVRLSDFIALTVAAATCGTPVVERGPLWAFRGRRVGGLSHGEDEPEGHFPSFCWNRKTKQ